MAVLAKSPYQEYTIHGPYIHTATKRKRVDLVKWVGQGPKIQLAYSRYLMEVHLNRILDSMEDVHHINGDLADDRLENLQVLNRSDHTKLHTKDNPVNPPLSAEFVCPTCGAHFSKKGNALSMVRIAQKNPKYRGPFCSLQCSGFRKDKRFKFP